MHLPAVERQYILGLGQGKHRVYAVTLLGGRGECGRRPWLRALLNAMEFNSHFAGPKIRRQHFDPHDK
jgi:hypothetical protein